MSANKVRKSAASGAATVSRKETSVPLYYQVEQDLRDRILRGEFGRDGMLPVEEALCESYGVSRITVRRAIDGLLAQRLVIKRHGVGSFVDPAVGSVRSIRLVGYMDDALAYVKSLAHRILSRATERPPPTIAAALQLAEGELAVRFELLVQDGELPFAYSNFYFPESIGRQLGNEDLVDGVPILRIVEHKTGQVIKRGEQTIRAIQADAPIAQHLRIQPGMPILQAVRTYYGADGYPVEVALVRYHPDRYDFTVDLVTHPNITA
jgi:GntR family transcriptional regulator